MTRGVLLDRTTGRPIVDPWLRRSLEERGLGGSGVVEHIERSRLLPALRMAEVTPPLYMDVNNAYSGDELGLPWRDVIGEGIVGAADLAVTGHAAANSVDIAAGSCWVLGDTNPAQQPNYRCYNNAVVNLGINPDPTNPRRVLVGAQVTDQGFAGVGRTWQLQALHGTPAASPVLPATPASFLPLANVLVPAAAASSAAYTITDLRARSLVGGGQAATSGGLTLLWDSGDAGVSFPAATVTTSTLPTTYKNLVVDFQVLGSAATVNLLMRVNGDTTGNYYYEYFQGVGATLTSVGNSAQTSFFIGVAGTAEPSDGTIRIPGYKDTSWTHGFVAQDFCQNDGSGSLKLYSIGGMWNSIAAITSLSFFCSSGNIVAGSRISVYGEA